MTLRITGLALLIALLAAVFFLRTPDTDPAAMTAKYTNAASSFTKPSSSRMRIHYRDQGNPDGMPIVLVHGSAASLHTWEPLVKLLGENFRLITLTLPGHGLTGEHPTDEYSYAGLAEAIDLVTDELSIDRFVLGGNSLGGWVTWRYAIDHPDKLNALLLLNAWGMPLRDGEEEPESNIGFKIMATPIGSFLATHYTPRSLVKMSALQSVSIKEVMTEDVVDRYWELLRFPGNRRAAGLRMQADQEMAFADRISEITLPTLILWGDEDQLIPISAATTFKERLPQAEVVILPGIGHLPMEEAPIKTARAIDQFLSDVVFYRLTDVIRSLSINSFNIDNARD